jgi:hypothetical protein
MEGTSTLLILERLAKLPLEDRLQITLDLFWGEFFTHIRERKRILKTAIEIQTERKFRENNKELAVRISELECTHDAIMNMMALLISQAESRNYKKEEAAKETADATG